MAEKTASTLFDYFSRTDTTLDNNVPSSDVSSGALGSIENLSSLHKSSVQGVIRRKAMTLKSEIISLSQIPLGHQKARDLLDAVPMTLDSTESVRILKHYCVVEGLAAGRDPNILPAELFTVIYDIVKSSEDDSNHLGAFNDLSVIMVGQDYGIVETAGVPSSIQVDAHGVGGVKLTDEELRELFKNIPGVEAAAMGPIKAKDVQDSIRFGLDVVTNKTIPLYRVYRSMLLDYAGSSQRSIWISGLYTSITASGNNRIVDGKVFQFMHLLPRSMPMKANQKVKIGDLIGRIGRSGLMGPEKDSAPHLHFAIKQYKKNGIKRHNPMTLMKKFFRTTSPSVDWKSWIIDEKAKWYSKSDVPRLAGAHGALDIGLDIGVPVYSPINGKVTFVSDEERYTKSVARFKEAIAFYNSQIKRGGFAYTFSVYNKDTKRTKTWVVPFKKEQTINLVGPSSGGGNDYAFNAHLGGKPVAYIRARETVR